MTKLGIIACTALAAALMTASSSIEGDGEPPWAEILGPSRAELPAPQDEVVWRTDLDAALEEARRDGRPLFVTLRCLPCDQCAEFDKDVLEGGGTLDPLLARFVTVRLTSMRDVDARLLPHDFQDLDLSWWGFVLSDDGRLYAVYGGRDEVSDTTRISVPSLERTLRRVLEHHYDPRRADWGVDPPTPDLEGSALTPTALPGWGSWAKRGAIEAREGECLHCHQVFEILRQPAIDAGEFDKQDDFYVWPFPKNVGLTLDRDDGLLVTAVAPGSAAARAGLRADDVLGAAGGRRLFGQADLRGVLHRAPWGDATIEVAWVRDGELHRARLALEAGWRETDLGWRKSVAEAAVGAHPGFPWPVHVGGGERKRRGIPADAMAVRPWFGPKEPQGLAVDAGLRGNDVIVAVDGESPNVWARGFLVWFRRSHEPGDDVELTVVNPAGERRSIRYELR